MKKSRKIFSLGDISKNFLSWPKFVEMQKINEIPKLWFFDSLKNLRYQIKILKQKCRLHCSDLSIQVFKKILCPFSRAYICCIMYGMYGVRNFEMTIRFPLKSRPFERFYRQEMSQIKAEISLHTNLKLIFHKNVGWQGYQWIP